MNSRASGAKGRVVEAEIELDAKLEVVWKALTDAQELTRWFPLEAKVTPGRGGSITMGWGGDYAGTSKIEIWEPGKRLRAVDEQRPFAAAEGSDAPVAQVAVDYLLETRGGKTVLRVVHSGFAAGADWDEEYEGVLHGWHMELRSLRNYLQHHRGRDRGVVWLRTPITQGRQTAWEQILEMLGIGGELREGAAYKTAEFRGTISTFLPPRSIGLTLENMNHGLLRMFLEKYAGQPLVNTWLSTWGLGKAELDAFTQRWTERLNQRFGSETKVLRA